MAKKKRFPTWHPKVGERALVPGTPANAQYVDTLDQNDVDAIEAGHRGYSPLRIKLFSGDDCLDILLYSEQRCVWESGNGGWCKNLAAAKRLAKRYWGDDIKLRLEAAV